MEEKTPHTQSFHFNTFNPALRPSQVPISNNLGKPYRNPPHLGAALAPTAPPKYPTPNHHRRAHGLSLSPPHPVMPFIDAIPVFDPITRNS